MPQKTKKTPFKSKNIFKILTMVFLITIAGCNEKPSYPVTIALNTWPGFGLLHLAANQGHFQQVGLDIKLVQVESLSDVLRLYLNGNVDGLAGTVIEAVLAQSIGHKPLVITMLTDYSNGADVIVSPRKYAHLGDLKHKTVGAEIHSLGIFFLKRALNKYSLTLEDINIVNVEQSDGAAALQKEDIDAFVTYPPASITALEQENLHTIFSSAELPNEIVDVIAISQNILDKDPDFASKLLEAWQLALQTFRNNPDKSISIMAAHLGIEESEFISTIENIAIMDATEQRALLNDRGNISALINSACDTLIETGVHPINCTDLSALTNARAYQL